MVTFSLFTWLTKHLQPPKIPEPTIHSSILIPERANLFALKRLPEAQLPRFVRESTSAMKYLRLLGPIDWTPLSERAERFAPNNPTLSYCQAELKVSTNQELKKSTFQDVNLSTGLLSGFFNIHPYPSWL